MAYVAILFLLILVLTMSLTFLLQAGTEATATLARQEGLQAEYLAEAAAHHAVWRLVHDPDLPSFDEAEAQDSYQMYSLGDGRYGYNLRPPTADRLATIRTVGLAGNSLTRQAYLLGMTDEPFPRILTAYALAGNHTPRERAFSDPQWGASGDTFTASNTPLWFRLAGSPHRREYIQATLNDNNHIQAAVRNEAGWSAPVLFSTNADKAFRGFDVAYESQSGNALLAGRNGTGGTPFFRVWNGLVWTPAALPVLGLVGGNVQYLRLASNPLSNEILLVYVNSSGDITSFAWNGLAWSGASNLTGNSGETLFQPLDVAYEQQSGRAVAVYGHGGNTMRYAVWNGASMNVSQLTAGVRRPSIVRMAADPGSNFLAGCALDQDDRITGLIWDGASWSVTTLDTNLHNREQQSAAVAWEASGAGAVVFYSRAGSNNVHYRRWNRATNAWSGVALGPNMGARIEQMDALTIPGTDRIILLTQNANGALQHVVWSGTGFEAPSLQLLHAGLPSAAYPGFVLSASMPGEE